MEGKMLKKNFSSSTLKMIALIAMLLDHIGVVIVYPLCVEECSRSGVVPMGNAMPERAKILYYMYYLLRIIGRLAFPIFAYMIVEGFRHTHNIRNYIGRLIVFAIVSEIPFDLAFSDAPFDLSEQNVMWTFAIAVLMLWFLKRYAVKAENNEIDARKAILIVGIAAICSMNSDGGFGGILLIASIYLFQKNKKLYWAGCLISMGILVMDTMWWVQIFAIGALFLLEKYNGTKGKSGKYLFYLFYPAHLCILWVISYFYI
jgi:hypothetical protein